MQRREIGKLREESDQLRDLLLEKSAKYEQLRRENAALKADGFLNTSGISGVAGYSQGVAPRIQTLEMEVKQLTNQVQVFEHKARFFEDQKQMLS